MTTAFIKDAGLSKSLRKAGEEGGGTLGCHFLFPDPSSTVLEMNNNMSSSNNNDNVTIDQDLPIVELALETLNLLLLLHHNDSAALMNPVQDSD